MEAPDPRRCRGTASWVGAITGRLLIFGSPYLAAAIVVMFTPAGATPFSLLSRPSPFVVEMALLAIGGSTIGASMIEASPWRRRSAIVAYACLAGLLFFVFLGAGSHLEDEWRRTWFDAQ